MVTMSRWVTTVVNGKFSLWAVTPSNNWWTGLFLRRCLRHLAMPSRWPHHSGRDSFEFVRFVSKNTRSRTCRPSHSLRNMTMKPRQRTPVNSWSVVFDAKLKRYCRLYHSDIYSPRIEALKDRPIKTSQMYEGQDMPFLVMESQTCILLSWYTAIVQLC